MNNHKSLKILFKNIQAKPKMTNKLSKTKTNLKKKKK